MKKMLIVLTAIFTSLVTTVVCLTASASTAKYLGDIDGNGKIESADARSVLRMAVGLEEPIVLDDAAAWEDGTKLVLHESQSLPYVATVPYSVTRLDETGTSVEKGETEVKIDNITIEKEHYDGVWAPVQGTSHLQKYRYHITIYGSCDLLKEQGINVQPIIQYFSKNKDGSADRYYSLLNGIGEMGSVDYNIVQVDDGGNFYIEVYQYNIFEDFDSFHISGFSIMYKAYYANSYHNSH